MRSATVGRAAPLNPSVQAQERAYRPEEPKGSHPPPRRSLYPAADTAMRYKERPQGASRRTHAADPAESEAVPELRVTALEAADRPSAARGGSGSRLRRAARFSRLRSAALETGRPRRHGAETIP